LHRKQDDNISTSITGKLAVETARQLRQGGNSRALA